MDKVTLMLLDMDNIYRYYKYNGTADTKNVSNKDIGLAIGRYESALLTDIVASYLFETTNAHFAKAIIWGVYRDDGL
eukprot:5177353-Ditylum_brightwellii.AAC.1